MSLFKTIADARAYLNKINVEVHFHHGKNGWYYEGVLTAKEIARTAGLGCIFGKSIWTVLPKSKYFKLKGGEL